MGHEGSEGEQIYSSTFSLTSALGGVAGQRQVPASWPPRKGYEPTVQEMRGTRARSGWIGKISAPNGIQTPDRPAHSELIIVKVTYEYHSDKYSYTVSTWSIGDLSVILHMNSEAKDWKLYTFGQTI